MNIDPTTTKYLISARIVADGIIEKPDVDSLMVRMFIKGVSEKIHAACSVMMPYLNNFHSFNNSSL